MRLQWGNEISNNTRRTTAADVQSAYCFNHGEAETSPDVEQHTIDYDVDEYRLRLHPLCHIIHILVFMWGKKAKVNRRNLYNG